MEHRDGFPDGSVPAAVAFLRDPRLADALPPEIAASGASGDAPPDAGADALPAARPADGCAEKLAARARGVLGPDGKELPVREPAPCTPGAVRFAA